MAPLLPTQELNTGLGMWDLTATLNLQYKVAECTCKNINKSICKTFTINTVGGAGRGGAGQGGVKGPALIICMEKKRKKEKMA